MPPKTLQQAIKYFSDEQTCIDTVAKLRWPNGPECPACGHKEHYWLASQKRWKCKECWKQFTVKLGTIFEDSPLPLDKWLITLWMLVNCKNGISSYEVAKAIGVSQKSAWFMLHRLRLALQEKSITKIGGEGGTIEADETFIGGRFKNMHASKRARFARRGGTADKTAVFGLFDREQRKVRAMVMPNVRRDTLQAQILAHVAPKSEVFTDQANAYTGFPEGYVHQFVNHLEKYVDGRVHTNCLENFWSLLKRSLNGSYVAVEPFHLFRYVDEQAFRFNNRGSRKNKVSDADRFQLALSQVAGKRLTYTELTGKTGGQNF
ncbi:MAG: IS1595 family transposase [Acidobacteriales bacterium]|nr:IS1595 family transposase [Terriglobales bacterium]